MNKKYYVIKSFVWFDFVNGYFFTQVYDVYCNDVKLLRTTSEDLAYATRYFSWQVQIVWYTGFTRLMMNKIKWFFMRPELYLALYVLSSLFAYVSLFAKHQDALNAKDEEIFQLRSKINNYLLSTGAYDRKTFEMLPLLKELGIIKYYYN